MAVFIEANYGKTIGLPNYSSHKFCVSIKSEVADIDAIGAEVDRLYAVLQEAVDQNIVESGYTPEERRNGHQKAGNGQSLSPRSIQQQEDPEWRCSPKQREYIETMLGKENVALSAADDLSDQLFGKSVSSLNRMEASGLIDELKTRFSRKQSTRQQSRGLQESWRSNGKDRL